MGKRGPKSKFIDVACPNQKCIDFGQTGKGNIVGNGTYKTQSGHVRKFICRSCNTVFCERKGTAFYDLRTPEENIILAMKLIVKGMSLRGVAEVLEVKLDTVRRWLYLAAEHSEQINEVLMKDIKVSKIELDELWSFVKKKQFRQWRLKRQESVGSG